MVMELKYNPKYKPGLSKYIPEFNEVAKNLCIGGATDKVLAKTFGVTLKNIHRWKARHPLFRHAVWEGKDQFDGNLVESALLKRVIGMNFEEVTKENIGGAMEVTKKIKKFIPPDTNAIKWWLRNRNAERWGVTDNPSINITNVNNPESLMKEKGIPIPDAEIEDMK